MNQTLISFIQVDPLGVQNRKQKLKSSNTGNTSYQLTSAGRSAHGWQISRHWLAGNFYFPCERIFISSFSEPLGINSEVLNTLLLW